MRPEDNNNYRHGEAINGKQTKEYRAWQAMKNRCSPNNKQDRKTYFDRGIRVCPEWSSFPQFLADMNRCPAGCQLDRRDNSKGYSRDNCWWRTGSQNCNNKNNNRRVTVDGITRTITQWAGIVGKSSQTLFSRARAGWPPREIVYGRQ